jgi:hypothetical protein
MYCFDLCFRHFYFAPPKNINIINICLSLFFILLISPSSHKHGIGHVNLSLHSLHYIKHSFAIYIAKELTVLYMFFCVFPRCQIVGFLGSETSANHNLTPEKYPKEHIQYSKHGESLKSRKLTIHLHPFWNTIIYIQLKHTH